MIIVWAEMAEGGRVAGSAGEGQRLDYSLYKKRLHTGEQYATINVDMIRGDAQLLRPSNQGVDSDAVTFGSVNVCSDDLPLNDNSEDQFDSAALLAAIADYSENTLQDAMKLVPPVFVPVVSKDARTHTGKHNNDQSKGNMQHKIHNMMADMLEQSNASIREMTEKRAKQPQRANSVSGDSPRDESDSSARLVVIGNIEDTRDFGKTIPDLEYTDEYKQTHNMSLYTPGKQSKSSSPVSGRPCTAVTPTSRSVKQSESSSNKSERSSRRPSKSKKGGGRSWSRSRRRGHASEAGTGKGGQGQRLDLALYKKRLHTGQQYSTLTVDLINGDVQPPQPSPTPKTKATVEEDVARQEQSEQVRETVQPVAPASSDTPDPKPDPGEVWDEKLLNPPSTTESARVVCVGDVDRADEDIMPDLEYTDDYKRIHHMPTADTTQDSLQPQQPPQPVKPTKSPRKKSERSSRGSSKSKKGGGRSWSRRRGHASGAGTGEGGQGQRLDLALYKKRLHTGQQYSTLTVDLINGDMQPPQQTSQPIQRLTAGMECPSKVALQSVETSGKSGGSLPDVCVEEPEPWFEDLAHPSLVDSCRVQDVGKVDHYVDESAVPEIPQGCFEFDSEPKGPGILVGHRVSPPIACNKAACPCPTKGQLCQSRSEEKETEKVTDVTNNKVRTVTPSAVTEPSRDYSFKTDQIPAKLATKKRGASSKNSAQRSSTAKQKWARGARLRGLLVFPLAIVDRSARRNMPPKRRLAKKAVLDLTVLIHVYTALVARVSGGVAREEQSRGIELVHVQQATDGNPHLDLLNHLMSLPVKPLIQ